MPRRKRDLASTFEKAVEEKVKEALDEREDETNLEEVSQTRGEEDVALKRILSSFPSSEGYYGKLHKVLPSGREEFKYHLSALEEISDPEVEVADLVKQRKWGSGSYRLRVFRHGEPGAKKVLTLSIDATENGGQPSVPSQEVETAKLKDTVDIVKTIVEMVNKPDPNPPPAPEKIGQIISDTLKSGIEIVERATSRSGDGKGQILEVINALKEAGVLKSQSTVSEVEITERVIKNLKELGVLVPPSQKDDILDRIIKLREAGIVKIAGEDKEDPLTSVEKIKALIDLVTPLVNPGTEKPNFWANLAPHIPKMIEGLVAPFKEYIDVKKAEINMRLKGPSIPYNPELSSVTTQVNPGIQSNRVHPILTEVLQAVSLRDHKYFPRLKELIILFIGQHAIEAMVSGLVSVDTFMSIITSSWFGDSFKTEEAKIYLQDFIEWLKQESPPVQSDTIVAKCLVCGAEYDITKESWKQEQDRICDCGGKLEQI